MRKFWVRLSFTVGLLLSGLGLIQQATAQEWSSRLTALEEVIADPSFTVHRMEGALLIKVLAANTFNQDRPDLLLPSALNRVGRLGRYLVSERDISVLVLGMSSGEKSTSGQPVSDARAKSLAGVLRLSKLSAARLRAYGVGEAPRGSKLAAAILIMPRNELPAFAQQFRSQPILLAQE